MKNYNRSFWVAGLASMIRSFGIGSTWPFLAIFFEVNLGVPILYVGAIFTAIAAVSMAFSLVGGTLGDLLGRKKTILIGSAIGFLTYFTVYLMVDSNVMALYIAIIFIISSISGSLTFPATSAIVADVTTVENRREGYSIYRILTNLGWAIGPVLGSFLYSSGVGNIFLFSAITLLLQLLIVLLFLNHTHKAEDPNTKEKRQYISFDRFLIIFSIGTFFMTVVSSQFSVTFPSYAVLRGNVLPYEIGYIYAVNGVVVVLGQFPTTRITRKISDLFSMELGMIFYSVGYLLSAFSSSLTAFIVDMVIITIGENLSSPGISSIVSKIAPKEKVARYNGFNSMINNVGRALGPSIGTFFMFIFNYNGLQLWASLDLFGVFSIILFSFFGRSVRGTKNSLINEHI
jgi:MFS family permease